MNVRQGVSPLWAYELDPASLAAKWKMSRYVDSVAPLARYLALKCRTLTNIDTSGESIIAVSWQKKAKFLTTIDIRQRESELPA